MKRWNLILIVGLIVVVSLVALRAIHLAGTRRPAEVQECDKLIPVINEYRRIHQSLPTDPAAFGPEAEPAVRRCNYERSWDSFGMGGPGSGKRACITLFGKLAEHLKQTGHLPDDLETIAPEIEALESDCGFWRGERLHYSMSVPGGICSMNQTGGCSASDCRTLYEVVIDFMGFTRPPVGRATWHYSSRLGPVWSVSCSSGPSTETRTSRRGVSEKMGRASSYARRGLHGRSSICM